MMKSIFKEYLLILKSELKLLIILGVMLLGYVLLFMFVFPDKPSCMIKQIIGYPCPGCGLTRSVISLLKLDFAKSFYYQPLLFLYPIIAFVLLFKERPNVYKIYSSKTFWIICGILFITVYIIRLKLYYGTEPMDYYPLNLIEKLKHYLRR